MPAFKVPKKNWKKRSGQSLIETLAGVVLLIPLGLFSYDLTYILISSQNNERLAENASRAAANHLDSSGAQQAAQQAIDNYNQTTRINNTVLTDFSYDTVVGQVSLTIQMQVQLPVPLANWKSFTLNAQSIMPIVATPAAM